jgi:hypothetical protein
MPKKKDSWKKPALRSNRHTKLTAKSEEKARASAKRAGRPYPNLVDNMNVAKQQRMPGSKKKPD